VLWQEKRTVAAYTGGAEIPVEFEIPFDAQQTDSRNPDDEILWRLSANSSVPGLDFRCEFLTPVFKTESSDPGLTIAALEAQARARQTGIQPQDSADRKQPGVKPVPSGGRKTQRDRCHDDRVRTP
jgi:hypothetical protein